MDPEGQKLIQDRGEHPIITNQTSETIYFAVDDLDDQNLPSKLMQDAFKSMISKKFRPKWKKISSLKSIEHSPNIMLVFDNFDHADFQYFRDKKFRIIGPLVILYCDQPLFRYKTIPMRDRPIYSQCMRGLEITCSNLPSDTKAMVERKVRLMAGDYYPKLHQSTSFLVSNSLHTQKYHVASLYQIPVMTVEWIEECWNESQKKFLHANDIALVERFRLPIFHEFNIVVSGFNTKERNEIKEIIEANGGKYHPALNLKPILPYTVLVLKDKKGDKYRYAKKEKIPCVRADWIYESLKAKYYLQYDEFDIDVDAQANNQKHVVEERENIVAEVPALIPEPPQQQPPQPQSPPANQKPKSLPEAISQLVQSNKNSRFLEDRIVHAIGFDPVVSELLKSTAKLCGALYYTELKPTVTDVIVGQEISPEYFRFLLKNFGDRMVKIDWFLACLQSEKLCSHLQYRIGSLSPIARIANALGEQNNNPSPVKKSLLQNLRTPPRPSPSPVKSSPFKNAETFPQKLLPITNRDKNKQIDDGNRLIKLVKDSNEDGDDDDEDDDGDFHTFRPKEIFEIVVDDSASAARIDTVYPLVAAKRESSINSCSSSKDKDEADLAIKKHRTDSLEKENNLGHQIIEQDDKARRKPEKVDEAKATRRTEAEEEDLDDEVDDAELLEAIDIDRIKSNGTNHHKHDVDGKKKRPKLMFSGFELEQKMRLIEMVKRKLSVDIHDEQYVAEDVTHLILKEPLATEKVLAVIAANVWILKPLYINDSINKGELQPEQNYQWGLYTMKDSTTWKTTLNNRERLMLSAYQWKQNLDRIGRRMFENRKFLFMNKSEFNTMYAACVNIVRAGGGQIYFIDDFIDREPELNLLIETVHFALINVNHQQKPMCCIRKLLEYCERLHYKRKCLFAYQLISKYIIEGPKGSLENLKAKCTINFDDLRTWLDKF